MLIEQQQTHIEMSLSWTGSFRKISKKLDSLRWRFDSNTTNLLKSIKRRDEEQICKYCNERNHNMFFAINYKENKHIAVHCEIPNFHKNFAYTERWDPDYINYPSLTFISLYKPKSFEEFEVLFEQFIQSKSEHEIKNFNQQVTEKYS